MQKVLWASIIEVHPEVGNGYPADSISRTDLETMALMATSATDVMIHAQDLGIAFEDNAPVLQQLNLEVQTNEFVALLGSSGCGKSTLLRMIAGLATPTDGTLTVQYPEDESAQQSEQGFVFQDPTLLPWRTVEDNIRLPLELRGASREDQREAVQRSLELIGLAATDATKYPRMLSGGMRMRVSLARALVMQPRLLLLDEPFAALDDIMRQQLNEDLLQIWQQHPCTALFVTHNVAEAVFLSQRVMVMSHHPGTIVETIEIPFSYPRSPELRSDPEFARMVGEVATCLRNTVS
jgi:NitT/TauT family transport system ATP-binding protein